VNGYGLLISRHPAQFTAKPWCLYDFTPRHTRDGPERFLAGFAGYLQADAFAGYNRLCAGPGVIRVACWAQARRKFYEGRTTAPLPAFEALARIRQLYRRRPGQEGRGRQAGPLTRVADRGDPTIPGRPTVARIDA
jgi:hypothetical protein